MKNEKAERFCRVAEARANKVIEMIRLLGKCSKKNVYEYTDVQVTEIFNRLHHELEYAEQRFTHPELFEFSLAEKEADEK